jgi:hypothetical protein
MEFLKKAGLSFELKWFYLHSRFSQNYLISKGARNGTYATIMHFDK